MDISDFPDNVLEKQEPYSYDDGIQTVCKVKWVSRAPWAFFLLLFTLLVLGLVQTKTGMVLPSWVKQPEDLQEHGFFEAEERSCSGFVRMNNRREKIVSIEKFGGVGDGKTMNTRAFQKAIGYLKLFADTGGAQLNVPSGRWVTGSFNLSSNITLYLGKDALILGSQDPNDWPLMEPLPSYGRGRERPAGRHISLIHGENLENVVVTGENGTIDGQVSMWWDMWFNRTLQHTRGHLVEFVNSENIIISNVTFLNSPFWNIHPVYCRNVVIKHVTILAPLDAPNTDGIDPDHLEASKAPLCGLPRSNSNFNQEVDHIPRRKIMEILMCHGICI